ncbi:MAG: lysophospholipid acyltransferase family protein [Prevotellaceae bacterium]|jgi:KDO2-lipid IV(A) lauroyltransferase|nr:lysophospholipid acyltransferase family protein [Prevotellaceae bacterium]
MKYKMSDLGYKCLKAVLFAVSLIPLEWGYMFAHFIYFLLVYVVRYRKKVIESNLRMVFPAKTEAEISLIAKKYYRHLSEIFVELAYSLYISEKEIKRRVRYTNPESVNKYYAEGRHIVGVTSHYANWEWGYGFQMFCNHKIMEVYKKMNNKIFNKLFYDIRSRFGGIPVEMSNLKPIVAEIRKHPALIYLVADQSPAGNNNTWYYTSFLGIDGTPVFTGPAKFAQRFNAAVVFVDMQKVKKGYYELTFVPICDNPQEMSENELTDRYLQHIEQVVYNKPEYWMWSHRRWKRRKITE